MTKVTILDGGLSTALEELGSTIDTSLWTGDLLRYNREQIRAAHQRYFEAGAKILISSSYQVTYRGCEVRGWSHNEVTEALQASIDLARFEGVKVAASIGPYGACLADGSEYRGNYGMTVDELKDFHRERLNVLISTNPDFLAVETIPELAEARAILQLLTEINSTIPFWISFSCRSASEISSGELFADAVAMVSGAPNLFGVGINCTSPTLIEGLLKSANNTSIPYVIYPNSGRGWDAVNKKWIGDKSAFTIEQISSWKSLGATVIGGCCGVSPSDITDLCERLS